MDCGQIWLWPTSANRHDDQLPRAGSRASTRFVILNEEVKNLAPQFVILNEVKNPDRRFVI